MPDRSAEPEPPKSAGPARNKVQNQKFCRISRQDERTLQARSSVETCQIAWETYFKFFRVLYSIFIKRYFFSLNFIICKYFIVCSF